MSQVGVWRNICGSETVLTLIHEAMQVSALGKVLDLLGELFDLLGLFHDRQRERGCRVCFINLLLEFRGHVKESRDIGSKLFLVRLLDGLRVQCARLVQAWRNVGVAAVGIWFGFGRHPSLSEHPPEQAGPPAATAARAASDCNKWRRESSMANSRTRVHIGRWPCWIHDAI